MAEGVLIGAFVAGTENVVISVVLYGLVHFLWTLVLVLHEYFVLLTHPKLVVGESLFQFDLVCELILQGELGLTVHKVLNVLFFLLNCPQNVQVIHV